MSLFLSISSYPILDTCEQGNIIKNLLEVCCIWISPSHGSLICCISSTLKKEYKLLDNSYNQRIPSEKTHMTKDKGLRTTQPPCNSQFLPIRSVWSTIFDAHLIILHSTLAVYFKSALPALFLLPLNISLLIFADIPGLMSATDKAWSTVITQGKGIGSVSGSKLWFLLRLVPHAARFLVMRLITIADADPLLS